MTDKVRLERTNYYEVYGTGPVANSVTSWLSAQPGYQVSAAPQPQVEKQDAANLSEYVVLCLYQADFAASMRQSAAHRRHAINDLINTTMRHLDANPTGPAGGPRKLIVISSAMVHGAWPERPTISDDAALSTASIDDYGVVGDLLFAEKHLAEQLAQRPELSWCTLRPAAVVGGGVDTIMTRHFEAPRILALKDVTKRWQFCHVDDLAKAVQCVALQGLEGTLVVGTPGTLTTLEVARHSHKGFVLLTARAAFAAAARLNRSGVMQTPISDLAFAVYPWTVAPVRLMEAGWQPKNDALDCLQQITADGAGRLTVAGQRLGKPLTAAAVGAAGAAVAVVGTAALVRKSRRK